MAIGNQYEFKQLSKKLIKFAPSNRVSYIIMFEYTVQKVTKRAANKTTAIRTTSYATSYRKIQQSSTETSSRCWTEKTK